MRSARELSGWRRLNQNVSVPVAAGVFAVVSVAVLAGWPSAASAMHEIDHRFVVEGHVCNQTGQPVADTQVVVKDVKVSDGATGFTDDSGYYKAVLHLHNDNLGDRIVVTALNQEQQTSAQFDAKDAHTERKVTVNFGTGCEHLGRASLAWLYYSIGVGVLAIGVVAGTSYWKKQRRRSKRGKGHHK